MYRLSYDGTIVDEPEFLVMGGQADAVSSAVRQSFQRGMALADAIRVAVNALASVADNGSQRTITAESLEVAVLDRNRGTRKFRRVQGAALTGVLAQPAQAAEVPNGEASETSRTGPSHAASEADGADSPEEAESGSGSSDAP
jgi:proteasome alpha subunit